MTSSDESNEIVGKRKNSLDNSPSKRICTIKVESASDDDATTVLDLNDDCLLKVFEYSNLLDLTSIADVCNRFKQNARDCFVYSKWTHLLSTEDFHTDGQYDQTLLKASKVLRNFGHLIVTFKLTSKFQNDKLIELLIRYCQNLKELEVSDYCLTLLGDARLFEPLYKRLRKLTLQHCTLDLEFFYLLPARAIKLRELTLVNTRGTSHQTVRFFYDTFRKLRKIELRNISDVGSNDIREMLKNNRQLKEIHIDRSSAYYNFDDILPSLADYAPGIEYLTIDSISGSMNPKLMKYFGQLSNLRSLILKSVLNSKEAANYAVLATCALSAANIPMTLLSMHSFKLGDLANRFRDAVVKLKQLEVLNLRYSVIPLPHIIEICKQCSELSSLRISVADIPTQEDIFKIIRLSKNLEVLRIRICAHPGEKIRIGIDFYMHLLKIVKDRCNKTDLQLILDEKFFVKSIPDDLAIAYRKSLTIFFVDEVSDTDCDKCSVT